MDGVKTISLKIINNPKGNIFHIIKSSSEGFSKFGEAYFSEIKFNKVKGWKMHKEMVLNLIVVVGKVQFVVYDGKTFFTTILSKDNYSRLTIEPNLWVAFKGLSKNPNLVLNIANIQHDPRESINKELFEIKYDW
tara:strand:- start:788 stop:1192 length:405 start_codon:yes stop_codon:yes gene_type:complete